MKPRVQQRVDRNAADTAATSIENQPYGAKRATWIIGGLVLIAALAVFFARRARSQNRTQGMV